MRWKVSPKLVQFFIAQIELLGLLELVLWKVLVPQIVTRAKLCNQHDHEALQKNIAVLQHQIEEMSSFNRRVDAGLKGDYRKVSMQDSLRANQNQVQIEKHRQAIKLERKQGRGLTIQRLPVTSKLVYLIAKLATHM